MNYRSLFRIDRVISTGVSLVLPHKFNIETGYSLEKLKIDGISQTAILYNTTLLRFGINNNSEIRFQSDYTGFKDDNTSKMDLIHLQSAQSY